MRACLPTLLFFYGLTTVIKQTERRQKRGCGGGIFQRVESVCMDEQPYIGRLPLSRWYAVPAAAPKCHCLLSAPRRPRERRRRRRPRRPSVFLLPSNSHNNNRALTHRCAPRVQGVAAGVLKLFPDFAMILHLMKRMKLTSYSLSGSPPSTL